MLVFFSLKILKLYKQTLKYFSVLNSFNILLFYLISLLALFTASTRYRMPRCTNINHTFLALVPGNHFTARFKMRFAYLLT